MAGSDQQGAIVYFYNVDNPQKKVHAVDLAELRPIASPLVPEEFRRYTGPILTDQPERERECLVLLISKTQSSEALWKANLREVTGPPFWLKLGDALLTTLRSTGSDVVIQPTSAPNPSADVIESKAEAVPSARNHGQEYPKKVGDEPGQDTGIVHRTAAFPETNRKERKNGGRSSASMHKSRQKIPVSVPEAEVIVIDDDEDEQSERKRQRIESHQSPQWGLQNDQKPVFRLVASAGRTVNRNERKSFPALINHPTATPAMLQSTSGRLLDNGRGRLDSQFKNASASSSNNEPNGDSTDTDTLNGRQKQQKMTRASAKSSTRQTRKDRCPYDEEISWVSANLTLDREGILGFDELMNAYSTDTGVRYDDREMRTKKLQRLSNGINAVYPKKEKGIKADGNARIYSGIRLKDAIRQGSSSDSARRGASGGEPLLDRPVRKIDTANDTAQRSVEYGSVVYKPGDAVLAIDKDGRWYEAKVRKCNKQLSKVNQTSVWEYLIHYVRWNSSHDEWLTSDKLLPDTPESRRKLTAACATVYLSLPLR